FLAVAGPEPAAADLMGIGKLHHPVGAVWYAARVLGRRPAGEPADGQIETAPEEMHRTHLAHKTGTKLLHHALHDHQRLPEAIRRLGVVLVVDPVVLERDRLR